MKKIEQQNIFNFNETLKFFNKFPIENWKIKRQTLTIILFQIWYDNILKFRLNDNYWKSR